VKRRISDTIQYYVDKLADHHWLPVVLSFGDAMLAQGEHDLAATACFDRVLAHGGLLAGAPSKQLPREDRLAAAVRARAGVALCRVAALQDEDPRLTLPSTLAGHLAALGQLRAALDTAATAERLYWLVFNLSVHVYRCAKALVHAGYAAQALPSLVHAVLAVEGSIHLCLPRFLPWRTEMYRLAVAAFAACGSAQDARPLVEQGVARVAELRDMQSLDPVPCPPETMLAYRETIEGLESLLLTVRLSPGAPPPGGEEGEPLTAEAVAEASAAVPDEALRLLALLAALQDPRRRAGARRRASPRERAVAAAARELATPHLEAMGAWLDRQVELGRLRAAGVAEQEEAAGDGGDGAGGGEGEDEAPVDDRAMAEAYAAGARTVGLAAHQALLEAAYACGDWDFFDLLRETCEKRLGAPHAAAAAGEPLPAAAAAADPTALRATAEGLAALRALAEGGEAPEWEHCRPCVDLLTRDAAEMAVHAPELVATMGTSLLGACRGRLDAYLVRSPDRDPEAEALLLAVDEAFAAVELPDAVTALGVALKLGLSLDKGGDLDAGVRVMRRADARAKAARTRLVRESLEAERAAAAGGARTDATLAVEALGGGGSGGDGGGKGPGEPRPGTSPAGPTHPLLDPSHLSRFKWVSASRSQARRELAPLVAAVTDTEQTLASLHLDVLSLRFRLELRRGVIDQREAARRRTERLEARIERRDEQNLIFGERTLKEVRLDEVRVARAGETTSNPSGAERRLLDECGDNPYALAALLMEMAPYHATHERRCQLLGEAGEALARAQAMEEALLSSLQGHVPTRRARPGAPVVLCRSRDVLTVTHPALRLKGPRPPATFAVFGKVHSPGLALSINSTAAEFEGLGVQRPLGAEVEIRGLPENKAFLLAVAAFDADGQRVGELGESGPSVVLCHALPVLHMHANLCTSALNLGALAVGRVSHRVLMRHFMRRTPDRALWEEDPSDSRGLDSAAVQEASPPLLRALTLAMYVAVQRLGLEGEAGELGDGGDLSGDLNVPHIEQQVSRVRSAKQVLMAMHIAACINDQQLLAEGAVRANNLLLPLLAMPRKSRLLAKGLGACCVLLRSITDVELHPCEAAAPAATQLTLAAIQVLGEAGEAEAVRRLGQLDATILRAAGVESQEELARLHEMLIRDPSLADSPAPAIQARLAEEADVVAAALHRMAACEPGAEPALWAALTAPDAPLRRHPRFVEVCFRVCRRAYEAGQDAQMLEWASQVQRWRRELVTFLGLTPAGWSLDAAVAESKVAALPEEEAARAGLGEGASEEEREAALLEYRRRDAAARFLQARLRAVLPVGRERRRRRATHFASLGWASRLALLEGLALTARAAGARSEEPTERHEYRDASRGPHVSREEHPRHDDGDDQDLSGFDDEGSGAGVAKEALLEKGQDEVACLGALRRFAVAVELAYRGRCWATLYNACGDLWDALKMVLEVHKDHLLRAEPRAHEVSITLDELNKKYFERALDVEGAAKPRTPAGKEVPGAGRRLNVIKGGDNIARVLSGPMARLMDLLEAHMEGTPLVDGAPRTELPEDDADSFDMGSDKVPDIWFEKRGDVDMRWLLTLVTTCMHIMRDKARPEMMFALGERFHLLSKEVFADKVVPLLIAACPLVGRDIAYWTVALEKAIRDGNAALEELVRVRNHVQKRLGLQGANAIGGVGRVVRKKPRRFLSEGASQGGSEAATQFADAASEASSAMSTSSRAISRRRRGKDPPEVAFPKEYVKVIETLKVRQEGKLVVQATNELGDVHAHFGDMKLACRAWGDALDALLGPYNCVENWRAEIGACSQDTLFQRFGVKSLLLGITLVGKLCRYSVDGGGDLRVSAAELACHLSAACFKCSFTHPQRMIDFGDYLPEEIYEGARIFADPYELNLPDLLSALETLCSVAVANSLSNQALPLLSLAEHLAAKVTRNLYLTVLSRVLRVQLLSHLGCLAPAGAVLVKLIDAEGLPSRSRGGAALMLRDEAGDPIPRPGRGLPPYQGNRYPWDEANLPVVQYVADQPVHPGIARVYGKSLTSQLQLARADFLRHCGAVAEGWGAADPVTAAPVPQADAGAAPPPRGRPQELLDSASKILVGVISASAAEGTGTVRSRPSSPQRQEPEVTDPRVLRAQEAARRKKGGAKEKPAKKASQKGKGPGAGDEPEVFEAPVGAEPAEGASLRARKVVSMAYLQLARVREQEWRYAKALDYTLEALAWAKGCAEGPLPDDSNDIRERTLVPPEVWLEGKAGVARLCFKLGAAAAARDALASLLADAEVFRDSWRRWQGQVLAQRCLAAEGHVLESCRALKALVDDPPAGRAMNSVFQRQQRAEAALDLGDVLDSLGLRKDANALWTSSCRLLKESVYELGLSEMLQAPENRSKTLRGATVYAESLLRLSTVLVRDTEFVGAVQAASEALRVLDFVACSPHLKARAALRCAEAQAMHVMRPAYLWMHPTSPDGKPPARVTEALGLLDPEWHDRAVLMGDVPAPGQPVEGEEEAEVAPPAKDPPKGKKDAKGKKGADAKAAPEPAAVEGSERPRPVRRGGAADRQARCAAAAMWQLHRAMAWGVLEVGHDHSLLANAARVAVQLHAHLGDPARAAHAAQLVGRAEAMLQRSQLSAPCRVAGTAGLRWAREMVHGREAFFLQRDGRFKPAPADSAGGAGEQARALAPGDMLQQLLRHLVASTRPRGVGMAEEGSLQATALHRALAAQSEEYAQRLCFAAGPPAVDPVAPLPLETPGAMLAVWNTVPAVPEAYDAWGGLHEGTLAAVKRGPAGQEHLEAAGLPKHSSWSVLTVVARPRARPESSFGLEAPEEATRALPLKVFRVPVESRSVRLWREILALAVQAVEQYRRSQRRLAAPPPTEAPAAKGKGKGKAAPAAEAPAADAEPVELPSDVRNFVATSLRRAFGSLRETVAPPAQRRRAGEDAAAAGGRVSPMRRSTRNLMARSLSRRSTFKTLVEQQATASREKSGKGNLLARAHASSKRLHADSMGPYAADTTEEASMLSDDLVAALLQDGWLERCLAFFDTRSGVAWEDPELTSWMIKLVTKPPPLPK